MGSDRPLHLRHTGRASHQNDALHILNCQMRIPQGLAYGVQGARGQGLCRRFKVRTFDVKYELRPRQLGFECYEFSSR